MNGAEPLRSRVLVQRRNPATGELRTLYAIAWERRVTRGAFCRVVETGIDYLHATSQAFARSSFYRQIDSRKGKGITVVDVAPAIGFHAEDDNGDVLSATNAANAVGGK